MCGIAIMLGGEVVLGVEARNSCGFQFFPPSLFPSGVMVVFAMGVFSSPSCSSFAVCVGDGVPVLRDTSLGWCCHQWFARSFPAYHPPDFPRFSAGKLRWPRFSAGLSLGVSAPLSSQAGRFADLTPRAGTRAICHPVDIRFGLA